MLVQCLYASRLAAAQAESQIDSIMEQSRRNNPRLGVTGILCFTNDVFIQVLEGGRDEVCDLYNKIVGDARHRDVRLLVYGEISERRFSNWTMGQVDIARVNPGLLLKYSKKATLDPFGCSGRATMSLIHELLDSGAIVGRNG